MYLFTLCFLYLLLLLHFPYVNTDSIIFPFPEEMSPEVNLL